jgi:mannitol/fructose-specific phosphotransferase system IIA component (Ntr-type)
MAETTAVERTDSLAKLFPLDAIAIGLENTSKQAAISTLVRRLVSLDRIPGREEQNVISAILARESLGTTALGNGVAFPHVRSRLTERLVGCLGLDRRGVPFDSLDGSPVYGVFLLLAPENVTKEYFEVLGRITAIGRDKSLRLQLRGCRSAEAVQRFLQLLDAD